jgi:multidrug efflux pump subunit AcrB
MQTCNPLRNRPIVVILAFLCVAGGVASAILNANNFLDENRGEERKPKENKAVESKPPPCVIVLTRYAGMPATDIEKDFSTRIERWVSQATGVRSVESRSLPGLSVVTVYFHAGADANAALSQVNSLALATVPNLPPGTMPPLVVPFDPASTLPVGVLVFHNPQMNPAQLRESAGDTVFKLKAIEALSRLTVPGVIGGSTRVLRINLDPQRMQARNLTADLVQAALAKSREPVALGKIQQGELLLQLDVKRKKDAEDLLDLPIKTDANGTVYLRDVGRLEDGTAPLNCSVRLNGKRTVCVPLYRRSTDDAGALVRAIRKALPAMRECAPAKVEIQFLPLGSERPKGDPRDTGLITIYLRDSTGKSLEASEKWVAKVERFIEETIPAAERAFILADQGLHLDQTAAYTKNSGAHDTTLRVQLSPARTASAVEYVAKLRRGFLARRDLAGLDARFHANSEVCSPIAIHITSKSLEQGAKLSQEVKARVAKVTGAVDVFVGERQDLPSLMIDVDRAKAAALGMSVTDILRQVAGPQADRANGWWIDPRGQNVVPLTVHMDRRTLDELTVASPKGQPVPLRNIATIQAVSEPLEIRHVDLVRVLTVGANVEGRKMGDLVADIERSLKDVKTPSGVRIEVKTSTTSAR